MTGISLIAVVNKRKKTVLSDLVCELLLNFVNGLGRKEGRRYG